MFPLDLLGVALARLVLIRVMPNGSSRPLSRRNT
jgi:hypothetical protein